MIIECLSIDELRELSEAKTFKAITNWLDENNIPYLTGAKRTPRVLRPVIQARLGQGITTPAPTTEPNKPRLHIPTRSRNDQKTQQG